MSITVPDRSAIAVEDTWDAASVFASDAEWESAIGALRQHIEKLQQFQGHLSEGPDTLLKALHTIDDITMLIGKIYVYASMFYEVDSTNQAAAAKIDRAKSLYGFAIANGAFIEPELIETGFDTIDGWMQANAELAQYKHYFAMLQQRQAHVRSAEVEEVLGLVTDPFLTTKATHGVLTDADMAFQPAVGSNGEEYEITQGTINALLTHPDREVRRSAFEHYADAHLAVKHTLANCLAGGVKQDVFTARVRNYRSSLEASLSENYIPVEVFHQLIKTCQQNQPIWHRYWRVRRKTLGYNKLHVYDVKAPLTSTKLEVPFKQAVDWIVAGMAPLGDEYVSTLRRGVLEQRWVDIYPNKGKSAGAFSSGTKGTHPFILMNYNNDVFGMSTLAHELGHSMHSYFTWQNQPPVYSDYTLFVAEVASNFNQAMVRDHLFRSVPEREFQLALIDEAMANFHRYFFIMPTLARFELEIHERVERGEALTADSLIKLMTELFAEGYGGEVEIDAERVGITWGQFSTHMYANFYVYQYATGIAAANALAAGVLANQPGARDNYLSFLRAGSSVYPLDALKLAGIDMTSATPIEQAYGVLNSIVDRLESLI